jgi:hypothetical protein
LARRFVGTSDSLPAESSVPSVLGRFIRLWIRIPNRTRQAIRAETMVRERLVRRGSPGPKQYKGLLSRSDRRPCYRSRDRRRLGSGFLKTKDLVGGLDSLLASGKRPSVAKVSLAGRWARLLAGGFGLARLPIRAAAVSSRTVSIGQDFFPVWPCLLAGLLASGQACFSPSSLGALQEPLELSVANQGRLRLVVCEWCLCYM